MSVRLWEGVAGDVVDHRREHTREAMIVTADWSVESRLVRTRYPDRWPAWWRVARSPVTIERRCGTGSRSGHTVGMSIFNEPIHTLRGEPTSLAAFNGKAVLAVNVASKCGLTPQYTGLEALQSTYGDRGFTVVGFPCNQFGAQEPGSAEEIETFCSTTYGVTFPMMEKIDVNGEGRHPIYRELTEVADGEGQAGDIRWNFEKFLIAPDGTVHRFGPMVTPEDPALVAAIEAALPA
jgi:glutathione peroxidase